MRAKQVLESVSKDSSVKDYIYNVSLIQRDISLTYSDIFGREFTYQETEEVSRGSWWKDVLYGKKQVTRTKLGRTPGMRAQVLQKYVDAVKKYNERKSRHFKKNKMRSKFNKM